MQVYIHYPKPKLEFRPSFYYRRGSKEVSAHAAMAPYFSGPSHRSLSDGAPRPTRASKARLLESP